MKKNPFYSYIFLKNGMQSDERVLLLPMNGMKWKTPIERPRKRVAVLGNQGRPRCRSLQISTAMQGNAGRAESQSRGLLRFYRVKHVIKI